MSQPSLRTVLAAAALTAAFGPLASPATAADPAKELPAAGCQTFRDETGDAHINNTKEVPYDADLDVTALTLRTTSTALVAYVKVADLKAGPESTDGHRFTVDFTFNGHVFSASGSAYKNGTGAIRDGLASTGQAGHTTQLGVDVPSVTTLDPAKVVDRGFKQSGLVVTFDQESNYVVLALPLADIAKYGGKPFGGTITNIDAKATVDNYYVSTQADTTNADNSPVTSPAAKWTVGDNRCFTVATRLGLSVLKYPATRTVTAKLTTVSGQPLAGQDVVFYLNGKRYATVRTASTGAAVLRNVKPGYTVKAQFLPTGLYLGSTASTKV